VGDFALPARLWARRAGDRRIPHRGAGAGRLLVTNLVTNPWILVLFELGHMKFLPYRFRMRWFWPAFPAAIPALAQGAVHRKLLDGTRHFIVQKSPFLAKFCSRRAGK
jgi:hypothetical protein